MGGVSFIYLNEQDMINAGVKDMKGCLKATEDMFELLYREDYRMGGENANEHGIRVSFPKESKVEGMPLHKPDYRFMAMPAYLGGRFRMFGIKSYGSNPDNAKKNLPRSILMMSLLDSTTGAPLAYMSANILSAMRTGAASGVGAKYLSIKNPTTVSIIGAGVIGKYTLRAIVEAQPSLTTIRINDKFPASVDRFIEFCKQECPQIKEFIVCDTIEESCANSDIIFFGTTNAAKFEDNPCVKKQWLKKGALVISASALRVDSDNLSCPQVKLVADNYKMYEGWGDGQPLPTQKNVSTLLGMGFYDAVQEGKIDKQQITDLGAIICKEKTGRENDEQIIFYAVGGMPIQDVAWAYDVYQNAIAKGIGTSLNVWEQSNL